MPFFSVIVPVYNVEKYLGDCIDSILNQSFKDFELILVNDGSKDRSGAICDAYAAQDVRVQVLHKPNGGVVSARKAGLQKSCGSYIVNIDSDDYIAPDYMAHFYKVITQENAEIVATKLQCVTENGLPLEVMEHYLQEGLYVGKQLECIYNKLLYDLEAPFHNVGCFPWNLCAKAVRKELIEKAQLSVPDIIRNGEDCAVMIPAVCNANSLYISNYCGYYYRQIGTSMVRAFDIQEGERLHVLLAYLDNLHLPIPKKNLVAFAAWMLWNQTVLAAKALEKASILKLHMQQSYGKVISFVMQGMKNYPMPTGMRLRMMLIRSEGWYILWRKYHK